MNPAHRYQRAVFSLIGVIVFAAPLFVAAGTGRWWNAWAYLAASAVAALLVTLVVYKVSPELAEERKAPNAQTKSWDRILVPMLVGLLPTVANVLAGLDRRLGWTTSITDLQSLIALVVVVASNGLMFWSMRANRFFATHYRIQTERGHTPVQQGPYAFLRHPGYLATIAHSLATPVLLGSYVALGAGIASVCLTILRTALEDRDLRAELPGYQDYAQKVRYRLVPLVW